jgi:hypothetical protein
VIFFERVADGAVASGSVALSEFPKIDPLPVASLPDEYATPGVLRKRKILNATEPVFQHRP